MVTVGDGLAVTMELLVPLLFEVGELGSTTRAFKNGVILGEGAVNRLAIVVHHQAKLTCQVMVGFAEPLDL